MQSLSSDGYKPQEELSAEGRRLLAEGWEDIKAGRLMGSDEAKQELGL